MKLSVDQRVRGISHNQPFTGVIKPAIIQASGHHNMDLMVVYDSPVMVDGRPSTACLLSFEDEIHEYFFTMGVMEIVNETAKPDDGELFKTGHA